MTILNDIQELLDEKDQPNTLREPSEQFPYERLLVACGTTTDKKTSGDILEITAHPQSFEGAFNKDENVDTYHLLQFQFTLSVTVSPDNIGQISSSLHFFNRLLHCPGFELDELSDRVFYRYVWFIKKKGIDSFLLMQVIGNLHLCYKMFGPYIKEIALGHYKLEDILEQVVKLSKQ